MTILAAVVCGFHVTNIIAKMTHVHIYSVDRTKFHNREHTAFMSSVQKHATLELSEDFSRKQRCGKSLKFDHIGFTTVRLNGLIHGYSYLGGI